MKNGTVRHLNLWVDDVISVRIIDVQNKDTLSFLVQNIEKMESITLLCMDHIKCDWNVIRFVLCSARRKYCEKGMKSMTTTSQWDIMWIDCISISMIIFLRLCNTLKSWRLICRLWDNGLLGIFVFWFNSRRHRERFLINSIDLRQTESDSKISSVIWIFLFDLSTDIIVQIFFDLIYSMKSIQLTCRTKRSIKTHVSYKKTFRIRSFIEKNNRDIQILRIRITYTFSFDKYMTDDLWRRYSICLVSGWCICDHTPLVTDTND